MGIYLHVLPIAELSICCFFTDFLDPDFTRVQACLPFFDRGKIFAVVVTVQVQLLVPEFMVTHLQPYLLIIPLCGQ